MTKIRLSEVSRSSNFIGVRGVGNSIYTSEIFSVAVYGKSFRTWTCTYARDMIDSFTLVVFPSDEEHIVTTSTDAARFIRLPSNLLIYKSPKLRVPAHRGAHPSARAVSANNGHLLFVLTCPTCPHAEHFLYIN